MKSGFIGGYASGQNQVYITNCKIEKGATIGCNKDQNNIGGFAGEFNGVVINCVNEGDVYGKNFVGGIIADKGQCMGNCIVRNCTFSGNVVATGDYVGGISGAAYGGTNFRALPLHQTHHALQYKIVFQTEKLVGITMWVVF